MKSVLYPLLSCVMAIFGFCQQATAQKSWYIDGYHGGVWGHYPDWNTRFMADQLIKHPNWNINIEIEPETWDRAKGTDPGAYQDFVRLFGEGRIEYVNPTYAQPYMFNISGESIIRQFRYGMQKLKNHFPDIVFTTYSSEEPCFTSSLPQILKSYGFSYASLKNPNTCFGGYTRAHGGELVNWVGPDGTGILTSPRYAVEALSNKSTWQTIAWDNSPVYISAAKQDGIAHPIGMTLQDAGWKGGPFQGDRVAYTTWRNYFENIAAKDSATTWKVSQEDILVNLVWGAQVSQQLAQRVRLAENKIIQSEKIAAIKVWNSRMAWPQQSFDSAWRTLLLAEHHDCWIVPYNGQKGDTWADKAANWTMATHKICDSINQNGLNNSSGITVYNTLGAHRKEVVLAKLPVGWNTAQVTDSKGKKLPSQAVKEGVLFMADVPALGNAVYQLEQIKEKTAVKRTGSNYILETDLYKITIDTLHGGVIKSLIAKQLGNKEFAAAGFNELRGNFYEKGGYRSSMESPVEATIEEAGPLRIKLRLRGLIAGESFKQTITLTAGDPKIDYNLEIDWKANTGIGQPFAKETYKWELPAKPFYNDSDKLRAMFPSTFKQQHISKDAPFDVTESKLENTFYNRWDSIKNNVLLNWVDVTDGKYGLAVFSDHTTAYTHGADSPLGLDIQYSGMGLWGRNYTVDGPTKIHYAILPHAGTWEQGHISIENNKWNEPLLVFGGNSTEQALFEANGARVSSVVWEDDAMLVRLFNPSRKNSHASLSFAQAVNASIVELNGLQRATLIKNKKIQLELPPFGIRTLKIKKA